MKTASDCVQSMTMLAKVYSKNEAAINLVLRRAETIHFPPQVLAAFCSAAARGKLVTQMPAFVLGTMEEGGVGGGLRKFSDHHLVTILASFAVIGQRNQRLADSVAKELAGRELDGFSVGDFAAILQSLANVMATTTPQQQQEQQEHVHALCNTVAKELHSRPECWAKDSASLGEMALLVKHFVHLGGLRSQVAEVLLDQVAHECAARQDELQQESVQFIIGLLGHFTKMDTKTQSHGVQELCRAATRELVQREGEEFRLHDFALTLKYLATLGAEDGGELEALVKKISLELVLHREDLDSMRGFDFAVILSCLQQWSIKDVPLMDKFMSVLMVRASNAPTKRRVDVLAGQELEYTLLCLEWFEHLPQEFVQVVAQSLLRRTDKELSRGFTVRNLGELVTCLRRNGLADDMEVQKELLSALAKHVLKQQQEEHDEPWAVMDMFFVLDMFAPTPQQQQQGESLLPPTLRSDVLARVAGQVHLLLLQDDSASSELMTNTDLAMLLALLARHRYHDPTLGNALASACDERNVAEFTLQELSQCLEGLEALGFDAPQVALNLLAQMTLRLDAQAAEAAAAVAKQRLG